MKNLNQIIHKFVEWALGISLLILGLLFISVKNYQLGLPYITFGIIISPIFSLPNWVRLAAAIVGLCLGIFD